MPVAYISRPITHLPGTTNLAQNGTAYLLQSSISSIVQSASMSSIVGAYAGTVSSDGYTTERLVKLRPRPHLRHPAMQDPPPTGNPKTVRLLFPFLSLDHRYTFFSFRTLLDLLEGGN